MPRSAAEACSACETRDRGQIDIQLECLHQSVQRLEQSLDTMFNRYSRFAYPSRTDSDNGKPVAPIEMSECANDLGNIADKCIILVGRIDEFSARCDW